MQCDSNLTYGNNTSIGNEECVYLSSEKLSSLFYKPASVFIITIFLPCVLAIGILSNSSYIIVFCRNRNIRTVVNYYLLTMACSDLIYLIFVVVDKQLRYYSSPIASDYGPWGPDFIVCKLLVTVVYVPLQISEMCILCYTTERYIALCHPQKRRYFSTAVRTRFCIFLIVILSFVVIIPCTYYIDGKTFCLVYEEGIDTTDLPLCIVKCGVKPFTFDNTFNLQCYAFPVIPFAISAVTILVLNFLIILKLRKSYRISKELGISKKSKFMKHRSDVQRMLLVNTIVFHIFLVPYFVDDIGIAFAVAFDKTPPKFPPVFLQISRCLSYTNSAINPIIYNILSKRIRHAFREVFCPCTIKDEEEVNGSSRTNMSILSSSRYQSSVKRQQNGSKTAKSTQDKHMQKHLDKHEIGVRMNNIQDEYCNAKTSCDGHIANETEDTYM